ncbi:MAG: tRNA uridine-5-carboxymethylaminomethyl(34) synthesis GTPase MnmE [Chitinophagales bacterium]|nr:tRNA uridine-5-carboxymethylaminomethyl(34) synthesis GTPase MnmE [Chitinophagales bacterium]
MLHYIFTYLKIIFVPMQFDHTIAAIATANGIGAIGIIRISGTEAISICNKIFKGTDLTKAKSHTIHYGHIVENNIVLDEVMLSIFKAPKSFTTEDCIEISCHGSPFILEQILQALIKNGARLAQPGEFTMRAYLNGRIDLSQAEAVADLIASNSAAGRDLALQQMRGGFANELKELRTQLIDFAALLELELDFSEEDVEFANRTDLRENLQKIKKVLGALKSSFQYGNAIKNGVSVALVGKPNAGKSSWINALTNDEISIVSSIAGTTRDKVEAQLNLNGVLFRLIDTAGIRQTHDEIESIGVERALQAIQKAELILFLFDISETSFTEFEKEYQDIVVLNQKSPKIIIANKADLMASNWETIDGRFNGQKNLHFLSAHSKEDVDFIKEQLSKNVEALNTNESSYVVSNARHFEALQQAYTDVEEVLQAFDLQLSSDLIAHTLRHAIKSIGSITGEIDMDEDILGTIFGKFCIGK